MRGVGCFIARKTGKRTDAEDFVNNEIMNLKLRGYCCSQIVMQIGLEKLGKDNDDLVAAMAGLCNGMETGKVCGCLSAGICLMFLADPEGTSRRGASEMTDWFAESFGETDCSKLLEGKLSNKVELCPVLIENTLKKVEEILEW